MQKLSFPEALELILQEDKRYEAEAYLFMRDALDFTVRMLEKPAHGPQRHVTGAELVEGIRLYACREYGPMAYRVLTTWGLKEPRDFGNIVFNLIGKGIFGKTPQDRIEDFDGGYNFHDAFVKPFRPAAASERTKKGDDHPQNSREELALGNS